MTIFSLIAKHRDAIFSAWFGAVAAEYDSETSRFLLSEKDPFNNPVGSMVKEGLDGVLDALTEKKWDEDALNKSIDAIVRIRAVQSFSPSQSLLYLQRLKHVIPETLKKQNVKITDADALTLNDKIDQVLFMAFDVYVACREQIFQFKANYVKDRTTQILKKNDTFCEIPEVGTDIIPNEVYKAHMDK